MDETTKQLASNILAKAPNTWTREDNNFIWKLIKSGHKEDLKALRNQAQLDG